MPEKEKVILPPKYYLDYFNYLVEFIQKWSGHCLGEDDLDFIKSFNNLSEDAKCLMVRMTNRKGEFFRLDKLSYEEIKNIPRAAKELVEAEFASLDPPEDHHLFKLFTKSELDKLFPHREVRDKYKEDLIVELAKDGTSDEYLALKTQYAILHFLQQEQVEYFKLLFFGHYHGMMTEFVIRDIGNVKLENLEKHEFTPWFESREEAIAMFELSKWDYAVKKAIQVLLPEEILDLIRPINWSHYINYPKSRKTGDNLMLRLGEYFEKAGYQEVALEYYELARKHPARERRIRILEKLGKPDKACEIAEIAYKHSYNASESLFMKDFLAKGSGRIYRSTAFKIRSSPEIEVHQLPNVRVEELALQYYKRQGYEGFHTENYLWRGLFGLFFWEELFDGTQATFHHPLQRMPSDLYNESFYLNRKDHLKKKLSSFRSRSRLIDHLEMTYSQKEDINNPLVGWHESLLPSLENCVKHLPLVGLKKVMLEIAKNIKDNSAGFPDLFIWTDTDYHFYEIKSPNDHLSSQQLFWIDFFNENKIKAGILRVNYK